MKTLILNLFRVVMIAMVTLAGCSPSGKFLRADLTSIEIAADQTDDIALTVEASSPWMVDTAGGADWLSVIYAGDDPNLLWVRDITVNESLEERSTEIYIVSGDGMSLAIPVVQRAMDVRFDVTPQAPEPFGARDSSTRTLTVTTNLISGWTFGQLHGDWLTIVQGGEGEENTLTVGARPTRLLDARRDTIVLRPANEAYAERADSIPILQAGIDLLVDSEAMDQTTYDIEIPAEGGEIMLWVYSRATWRVSTEAPAERVTIGLAEGGADIENGIPVVMTVAKNTGVEEYEFTLTFESADETYEYICRQQGGPTEPEPERGI